MGLDAVCLRAILEELRPQLLGARIDKVQQPARDQVILLLRGNRRLLLNAGPGAPRLHLTERIRDNPAEPPMFCMLLRKHLVGARIADLVQPGLERLVRIELDVTDDFGQQGRRTLILEAMGRRSNLVLLDGESRVVDCLRRVDAGLSAQRQILPGLFYQPPLPVEKTPLTELEEQDFLVRLAAANPERRLDEFLLDQVFGLSPLIARELACRAQGSTEGRIQDLDSVGRQMFWRKIQELAEAIKENNFTPFCLRQNGKFFDYSYMELTQYGGAAEPAEYGSFSALLDDFYAAREQQERVRQRGQDLVKTAATARDRLRRKLAVQERDYAETQNRDRLRICGDLITANLYRMERGAASLTTENYYDASGGSLTIALDPLLTPQQNAAKYYKRYTKAKTAQRYLLEQMEIARRDAEYLESVLEELNRGETEQDFLDIRAELRDAGYLRPQKGRKELNRPAKPREFRTSAGLAALVGRNNRQNDKLTLKDADRRDLWFHTQKIHGSHVILRTGGAEPDAESVTQAAQLAAWFSQARDSANVPVDYTPVRNVKKPAGGRPGMVVYDTCRTVCVTPDGELTKRLQKK